METLVGIVLIAYIVIATYMQIPSEDSEIIAARQRHSKV